MNNRSIVYIDGFNLYYGQTRGERAEMDRLVFVNRTDAAAVCHALAGRGHGETFRTDPRNPLMLLATRRLGDGSMRTPQNRP